MPSRGTEIHVTRETQLGSIRSADIRGTHYILTAEMLCLTTFFQSIRDSDSSDSDEGEESPQNKMQFDLGRFCAKRVRTYHQFTHWEVSAC